MQSITPILRQLLALVCIALLSAPQALAQCTGNPAACTPPNPGSTSNFHCFSDDTTFGTQGTMVGDTIYLNFSSSISTTGVTATVDSVQIGALMNVPSGLTMATGPVTNPSASGQGPYTCFQISGTPSSGDTVQVSIPITGYVSSAFLPIPPVPDTLYHTIAISGSGGGGGSGCSDTTACTPMAIAPNIDNMGCTSPPKLNGQVGTMLQQTVYFNAADSLQLSSTTVQVDSIHIDSITHVPAGLQVKPSAQDSTFLPPSAPTSFGPTGCLDVSGTPQQATQAADSVQLHLTVYGNNGAFALTTDGTYPYKISISTSGGGGGGCFDTTACMPPNVAQQVASVACTSPPKLQGSVGMSMQDTVYVNSADSLSITSPIGPVQGKIDSIRVDSITNVPAGLTINVPAPNNKFYPPSPGSNFGPVGCFRVSGTPTQPTQPTDSVQIHITGWGSAMGISQSQNGQVPYKIEITGSSQPLSLSVDTVQDVVCHGDSTGQATVTASGGQSPYTYALQPTGTVKNSGTFTTLAAGNYSVIVTDNQGATDTVSLTVSEPSPIQIQANTSQATCGNADGSATAMANGGSGTLNYNWQPAGSSGPNLTNVPAGSYTLTVTDTAGCSVDTVINITNQNGPGVPMVSDTTGCMGLPATLTAGGATPGDTLKWYTNSTAPSTIHTGTPFTTDSLTQDTTFYVSLADSVCEGPRVGLDVNLMPQPQAAIAVQDSMALPGDTIEVISQAQAAASIEWYVMNQLQSSDDTLAYAISASASGSVAITLKALGMGTCPADSETITITITDRAEGLARGRLRAFPNPTGDHVFLRMQRPGQGTYRLRLTNVHGQMIRRERIRTQGAELQHQLEMTNLPKGVYFLQVTGPEGGAQTLRLLKR